MLLQLFLELWEAMRGLDATWPTLLVWLMLPREKLNRYGGNYGGYRGYGGYHGYGGYGGYGRGYYHG